MNQRNFNGVNAKVLRAQHIGLYLLAKYQLQAHESGTQRAARNLRKQGVPLQIALLILAYK